MGETLVKTKSWHSDPETQLILQSFHRSLALKSGVVIPPHVRDQHSRCICRRLPWGQGIYILIRWMRVFVFGLEPVLTSAICLDRNRSILVHMWAICEPALKIKDPRVGNPSLGETYGSISTQQNPHRCFLDRLKCESNEDVQCCQEKGWSVERAAVWWVKLRADVGITQALHCEFRLTRAFKLVQVAFRRHGCRSDSPASRSNLAEFAGWKYCTCHCVKLYKSVDSSDLIMMLKLDNDVFMVART